METRRRSILKAVSWQVLGLFVTALLSWILTGLVLESVGLAFATGLSGLVMYFLHERCWQQVRWGLTSKA